MNANRVAWLSDPSGSRSYDVAGWGSEIVSPFLSDLYNMGAEILDTKKLRPAELESACASERLDGKSVHFPFPLIVALDTLAKMRSNRSPGHDGVTVEMLQLLDAPCLELIRDAFERRLNCLAGACDPVLDWLEVSVHCIPKVRSARSLSQWHPISLVATLAKWFGACLVYLLRTYSDAPVCNLFGFEPGRRCAEIFDFIQVLLEKSEEWNLPIPVGKGDVGHAFDYMYVPSSSGCFFETQTSPSAPPRGHPSRACRGFALCPRPRCGQPSRCPGERRAAGRH